MSTYFKYRFLAPETTPKVLIVVSSIIAFFGVIHWAYCGTMGNVSSYQITDQEKVIFSPPTAFIAVTGLLQILTSAAVILTILKYLGQTNRYLWARLLLLSLFLSFAFNFAVAVSTGMRGPFYNERYKYELEATNLQGVSLAKKNVARFNTAEAVMTWILTIPLITFTIIGLLDQILKQDDDPVEPKPSPNPNPGPNLNPPSSSTNIHQDQPIIQ